MHFPQSPLFWILTVGIAVVAIIAAAMSGGKNEKGFKDIVKSPPQRDAVGETVKKTDAAVEASMGRDDEKVEALTRGFVFEDSSASRSEGDARILNRLGSRTHSAVIQILRDPALRDRLVKMTETSSIPKAPFNRACDLLGDSPPPEAIEALAPFLDDPSNKIRESAALAIGRTGDARIVPHIRKALHDSEDEVRSNALLGLVWALERDALAPECARDLFADIQRLLEEGKNTDSSVEILFRFDAEKATRVFLSPHVWSADSPVLYVALETLASNRAPVPRDKLLALIRAIESEELDYPRTLLLGGALHLLGQRKHREDREFLMARMAHSEDRVAEGASKGLLSFFDLEGFDERIWEAEEKSGYKSLPKLQRYYLAVVVCNGQVNNGGLDQYFFNSTGDQWKDAVAGFEAMGSPQRLGVLREAVSLFGGDGPSEDRRIRVKQLEKLRQKKDAIFADLDQRYYKSSEDVESLAHRFVLANPESFR